MPPRSPLPQAQIPQRQKLPADAPPIRVGVGLDPAEAAAQDAADKDVLEAWNEWKDAGRPSLFNKSPRSFYIVPEADAEKTVKRLQNAARLYNGVRIEFAKPFPVDKDGNAWIYWVAKERQPRKEADAKRGSDKPAEPATPQRQTSTAQVPQFIPPSR